MNYASLRTVLVGGLIGGAGDILFAIVHGVIAGTPPVRLLQFVASGLFGRAALDGGIGMAAWGLAAHFGLSLFWAGLLLLLAWRRPGLVRNPYLTALLFGIAVFLAMRLVVVPLSAFPFHLSFKPAAALPDLVSHIVLFGLPIAFAVRSAVARPVTSPPG